MAPVMGHVGNRATICCAGPDKAVASLVTGDASCVPYGDGDLGARRGTVEVNQCVSRTVGLIAPGVTLSTDRRIGIRLVRIYVNVVLIVRGVVDGRGLPCTMQPPLRWVQALALLMRQLARARMSAFGTLLALVLAAARPWAV